jgi:hypothetical protein
MQNHRTKTYPNAQIASNSNIQTKIHRTTTPTEYVVIFITTHKAQLHENHNLSAKPSM